MSKRNLLFATIGLVVLISAYIYSVTRPSATPETYFKAKTVPSTSECLSENRALKVPDGERSAIELAAVSYLVDVPAGTNVDVKIATYTKNKATGSDYYPAKYGNYNFAMVRQGDTWRITEFKHCS